MILAEENTISTSDIIQDIFEIKQNIIVPLKPTYSSKAFIILQDFNIRNYHFTMV